MTEMFIKFATEVNEGLINTVEHSLMEGCDIRVELDGEVLIIPVSELQKHYQLYSMGRKTFSQAVTKAATTLNKTITQWYNL